jgi:hypothetical protein
VEASSDLHAYGDNVTGADNQQERLDGYMSGCVDGEGSFSVVVNRNPSCKTGYQLVPEFHVSQNGDRAPVRWMPGTIGPARAFRSYSR